MKNKEIDEEVVCPFCKEDGFDLIGLKDHLQNYCDVFTEIETLPKLQWK